MGRKNALFFCPSRRAGPPSQKAFARTLCAARLSAHPATRCRPYNHNRTDAHATRRYPGASAQTAGQGRPHRGFRPHPVRRPPFRPFSHTILPVTKSTPTLRRDAPAHLPKRPRRAARTEAFARTLCAARLSAHPATRCRPYNHNRTDAHATRRYPGASAQTAGQGRPHRGFRPHPVRCPAFCPPGYTMPTIQP